MGGEHEWPAPGQGGQLGHRSGKGHQCIGIEHGGSRRRDQRRHQGAPSWIAAEAGANRERIGAGDELEQRGAGLLIERLGEGL
jgi:hypothetical protein